MKSLRALWDKIKPVSRAQWIFSFAVVSVLAVVLIGTPYVWDYTNSSPFCGTTCHTMPPHYESFRRSPHARVECTECHIGRTFVGVAFTRKAVDAQFVIAYATGNYEYPIFAKGLQPARESCEKCHWPDKFSWDKAVTFTEYASDNQNTPSQTTIVLKTGGGTQREGLGKGIHWHTQADIEYAATGKENQEIPYIEVVNPDGTKTVYTDTETKMTAAQIAALPKRRMDCIDCHNRVSHSFTSPDEMMDTALSNKQIDTAIPEIKKKGVQVLTPNYPSTDAANKAIAELEQFYKQAYADYYAKNTTTVQTAIGKLKEFYTQIHYPDQGLDWTIHPNNLGHKDWPGCFRCHDGKHLTQDRKQAIRLECNICHTLPQVSTPGGPAAILSLARSDEPETHKTTTWLAQHRTNFNTSCQACHDTNNAGGKDNSSFCSNSACHGTTWKFVGLNGPELAKSFTAPIRPKSDPNSPPAKIPHPVGGNPDCQLCHGANSKVRPFPSDHTGRTNEICQGCHKPTIPTTTTTTQGTTTTPSQPTGGPPKIPHDTAGRAACLGCHGSGASGVPQVLQFHKDYGFTNNDCLKCHQAGAGAPKPTPAPGATTPAPASGGIKKQPADHAGRVICLACHNAGLGPKPPADHAGRTDDTCKACHAAP
jgi:nitrate/TMAO reductase-like tetraheme cytochrome c subunit